MGLGVAAAVRQCGGTMSLSLSRATVASVRLLIACAVIGLNNSAEARRLYTGQDIPDHMVVANHPSSQKGMLILKPLLKYNPHLLQAHCYLRKDDGYGRVTIMSLLHASALRSGLI